MMRFKCNSCNQEASPHDEYCTRCGSKMERFKLNCLKCGNEIKDGDKFCSICGVKVLIRTESNSDTAPKEGQARSCNMCYFIKKYIPPSTLLNMHSGKAVSEAITKIKEDELKLQDSEMKQKVKLISMNMIEWGFNPVMSIFCAVYAEDDKYSICEVKNRAGDCPDFKQGKPKYVSCITCMYQSPYSDPFKEFAGIKDSKIYNNMCDARESEIAIEITSIYHNRGKYHTIPLYHDYCTYLSSSEYIALPYANIYGDCPYYELK